MQSNKGKHNVLPLGRISQRLQGKLGVSSWKTALHKRPWANNALQSALGGDFGKEGEEW